MNKRRWFAGILLGATFAGTACGSEEPAAPPAAAPSSAVTQSDNAPTSGGGSVNKPGDPAAGADYNDQYNFTATTFDGETFELAAYKGTPVVINFWESW